jgi:hypothetical protein
MPSGWIDSIEALKPIVQRQNRRGALGRSATIRDLLDLPITAERLNGQDSRAVHRE